MIETRMFRIKRFYKFKEESAIKTHLGTLVQCFSGLPPITFLTKLTSPVYVVDSPYLGRSLSDIKKIVPVLTRSSLSKKMNFIALYDGYRKVRGRFSMAIDRRRYFRLGLRRDTYYLPAYIGTMYTAQELVFVPSKGRIAIYDEKYGVYLLLSPAVQWIARAPLTEKQSENVRRTIKQLLGVEREPVVTYRYSFGGYYALLSERDSKGKILIHMYHPSSNEASTQKFLVYQRGRHIKYAQLNAIDPTKDIDWLAKIVSAVK